MAKTLESAVDYERLALYDTLIRKKVAVKTELPHNLSDLQNDQGYQTNQQVNETVNNALESSGFQKAGDVTSAINKAATEKDWQSAAQVVEAINEAIKDFVSVEFRVVTELPPIGDPGVIYLKKAEDADDYAEFVWITADDGGRFEMLGTAGNVDLSGYLKMSDVTIASNEQITSLVESWE